MLFAGVVTECRCLDVTSGVSHENVTMVTDSVMLPDTCVTGGPNLTSFGRDRRLRNKIIVLESILAHVNLPHLTILYDNIIGESAINEAKVADIHCLYVNGTFV